MFCSAGRCEIVDCWCSEIGSSTRAVFMSVHCAGQFSTIIIIAVVAMIGHSTIFELYAPFSEMLQSHYAVTLSVYQKAINFDVGKHVLSVKSKSVYIFAEPLALGGNVSSECHLTDSCPICCMLS